MRNVSNLVLKRFSYSPTETEGRLYINRSQSFATIERPWVGGHRGGMPFESCVPDGEYDLIKHVHSRSGRTVLALINEGLGVYYQPGDMGESEGRYAILIHSGNYVEDVVGCIAPGLQRTIYNNRRMVTSSRRAMQAIMAKNPKRLIIEPATGTD